MSNFLKSLCSRKFIILILLLGVGLVVDVYTKRGLSQSYLQLMIYLGSGYFAANVGAKGAQALSQRAEATSTLNQQVRRVQEQQEIIMQYNDAVLQGINTNSQAIGSLIEKNNRG